MLNTAPQRPGMGSRTSSAPAGGLYKLDAARKPGSGTNLEQPLLEEEEGSPTVGEAKSPQARQSGEVCLQLLGLRIPRG